MRRAGANEGDADPPDAAPTGRVIRVEMHEGMTLRDAPSIDLGAWAATLFNRTMVLVMEHRLSAGAATADVVEASRRDVSMALEALRPLDNDDRLRDVALGGIVGALTIGFHHLGGPEVVEQVKAKAVDKMHKGRRRDDVRAIINCHARAHWAEYPEHIHRAGPTALAITDTVAEEVQTLPKVKKGWAAVLPLEGDAQRRYTENIQRNLKKCRCWTTVIRP